MPYYNVVVLKQVQTNISRKSPVTGFQYVCLLHGPCRAGLRTTQAQTSLCSLIRAFVIRFLESYICKLDTVERTCNGFVLQMAHFYSRKIDCKEIPSKYYQMIPKSL